jgi:DNA processing protein
LTDLHLLALHRLLLNKPGGMLEAMAGTADASLVLQGLRIPGTKDALKEAEGDLNWLQASDHHLIRYTDDDYPGRLKEIWNPPYLLYASGHRNAFYKTDQAVAVVGARKASSYGLKQAAAIAEELGRRDVTVVSGLALGIDAAAHEGALLGHGTTIAVLGTSCDDIYPKRNWRLAERIQSHGLIISEFPLGTPAYPANFPRRNRIVTGLAVATVVVEAALKSGSLISARLAGSEGREVMAVPGQVTNPQSRGCHQLIRDGATLIETASDILRELGIEGEISLQMGSHGHDLSPDQLILMEMLAQGPQSIDMLMDRVELCIEDLTVGLVSLEVLGLIFSEGGRYQLARVSEGLA